MINGHEALKNWWIQMRNNVFASARSTALNGLCFAYLDFNVITLRCEQNLFYFIPKEQFIFVC